MNILVLNAGSSSLKYELFNAKGRNLTSLYRGAIERISQPRQAKNHFAAVKQALQTLLNQKVIQDLTTIQAIGHRVVHGGETNNSAITITPKVERDIKQLSHLAPLHNPANLAAIQAAKKILPMATNVAVFDTAFHATLPPKAFLYALPYDLYKKHNIRRYGFHGISHAYVSRITAKLLKKQSHKIITCHLGNGSSITAIKNGKSLDTSMGFTPLAGVPMGTRCGTIDPAIPLYLQTKLKRTPKQVDTILNKKSGLKGISQLSSDLRDLLKTRRTNKNAQLALDLLSYKTAQTIASFTVSLNGLDAITFTGGIGENSDYIRAQICQQLKHLGVILNKQANRNNKLFISTASSKIKVFVIPAHEEQEIAHQVQQLCHAQV